MSRFNALRDVLTRASTWFAIFAALSALYAAFGAKPQANWQVIKAADQATTLPSNDVEKAPSDAIVYKGLPVDEVKQRELAEKISSALAVLFTILAAFTGQREDPPSTPTRGSLGPLALLLPLVVLVPALGCASVAPGHDPLVVNAERSISVSFDAVDALIKVDHDNREAFARDFPAIHAFAELIRRDAPAQFAEAREAVRLYKSSRTTSDGDAMNAKLARVQSLARTAREYLIRIQNRG